MALIVPFPDELKLENYERRPNAALFDRLDLVVYFHPGYKGMGAVVKNFRDAIKSHDEMVVKVEAQMVEVEIKKRIYRKKNRLFRNLDSAWNLILENPIQYYEYLNLFKTLTGYCQRSPLPIGDGKSTECTSSLTPAQHTYIKQQIEEEEEPIEKVKLTGLYVKYTELEPVCSRQHLVYLSFARAREERDQSVQQLLEAEK
ncbi:hypothetical protein EON65_42110 [archaeon]|nr:MAG: hypothetical protein EON65_42110 [archaeon]